MQQLSQKMSETVKCVETMKRRAHEFDPIGSTISEEKYKKRRCVSPDVVTNSVALDEDEDSMSWHDPSELVEKAGKWSEEGERCRKRLVSDILKFHDLFKVRSLEKQQDLLSTLVEMEETCAPETPKAKEEISNIKNKVEEAEMEYSLIWVLVLVAVYHTKSKDFVSSLNTLEPIRDLITERIEGISRDLPQSCLFETLGDVLLNGLHFPPRFISIPGSPKLPRKLLLCDIDCRRNEASEQAVRTLEHLGTYTVQISEAKLSLETSALTVKGKRDVKANDAFSVMMDSGDDGDQNEVGKRHKALSSMVDRANDVTQILGLWNFAVRHGYFKATRNSCCVEQIRLFEEALKAAACLKSVDESYMLWGLVNYIRMYKNDSANH